MAVFAVVDEAGFERRLDARDDGLVDVALALLAAFDLVLEVHQLLAVDDRQAALFGLRGIDQHAFHSVSFIAAAGLAAAAQRHRPPALRRAARHDAGETRREPLARIALDCVACGPVGPSASAALARACQRSACVSCGVDPRRCIVRSGHAATRAAAAWRRQQRSGMGAGDGGQHASWRRWTRVQGRSGPSCTGNFSGAPQGWVLVACLCAARPWPPGHLGTTAHRRAHRHCITCTWPASRPMRPHFRPWSAPGKLRQIKHLRVNRGPAHYRGQRPIGVLALPCPRRLRPPRRP